MSVGELKQLLAKSDLPDTAPVLVPGSDHSYYTINAEDGFAAAGPGRGLRRHFSEYYDDETLDHDETKIRALILQ